MGVDHHFFTLVGQILDSSLGSTYQDGTIAGINMPGRSKAGGILTLDTKKDHRSRSLLSEFNQGLQMLGPSGGQTTYHIVTRRQSPQGVRPVIAEEPFGRWDAAPRVVD